MSTENLFSVASSHVSFDYCPECQTTKLMMPNLQLKFSTCCGRTMCIHCIENRFKTVKIWTCTLCHEQLKKTSWDVVPIEEQRFKTEVQNRQETNRIFTLDLIDFPSKREYDDYLELTADVIYSLTYGSRNEQQAARQRLADFQRVNRALIDKSKARKFQEKSEEERKERRKEGNHNNTQDNVGYSVPSGPTFAFPVLDSAGAPPSSIDREKAIYAITDPAKRHAQLTQLMEERRMASGFKREDDRKRSREEAFRGLFKLPTNTATR